MFRICFKILSKEIKGQDGVVKANVAKSLVAFESR